MKKLVLTALITVSLAAFASASLADSDDSFFKVGQCYLFLPRHDYFDKGQVVMVTPQEVVFKNIVAILPTKNLKGSDEERIAQKDKIIEQYWHSKNRSQFESKQVMQDVPASYSRSEMTALELDRCGN